MNALFGSFVFDISCSALAAKAQNQENNRVLHEGSKFEQDWFVHSKMKVVTRRSIMHSISRPFQEEQI
jgi:hypothetical protein